MAFRIGCDVGGTFTDLCLFDDASGRSYFVKTPTTTGNQDQAVVAATRIALAEAGIAPDELAGFAHGTTVATNAILERKGARTALLITRGFRDLLAIGRQTRPHLYDQYARRPSPLVPEELVFEIDERLGADGKVITPLGEASLADALERMRAARVETVAIAFLHSYANPDHERSAAAFLAVHAPDLVVSISSDVLPEPGEYERASTTVMNAYLMPPLAAYLRRIAYTLEDDGIRARPVIMQSGGGVMTIETASGSKAVHTCLSGPAAGMIGARRFAEAAGLSNVVTIDMGGTSFDVGLIQDGEILTRYEGEIEGFPLRVPMFDIITLGAGGGSIAGIDPGGLLKVGPESAGAVPGPAAYGKGGERATVTDANVVLGRLRDGRPLGGGIRIDRARAAAAIQRDVAKPLGISVEEAAIGILRVVNAAMVRGMRRITIERGLDPRDFAVMAFGGAGPLHAVDLCQELETGTLIVPPSPGLLCGIGLLLAPWRHDETAMLGGKVDALSPAELDLAAGRLREAVLAQARRDEVDPATVTVTTTLDMCYSGQGYQIPVIYRSGELEQAVEAFHDAHRRAFGYERRDRPVDIRVMRSSGTAAAGSRALPVPARHSDADPLIGRTRLFVDGVMQEAPVYDRQGLKPGTTLRGPLLIEQLDTTLVVGAQEITIDEFGSIIIRFQQ
jgi:N-methylhydantoinase A/acetone carboxylase, beta subunit